MEKTILELLDGKVTGPDYVTNARRVFGTRVRIARIASSDPDERSMEGLTGELTAPFANFEGLLGIYIDGGQSYRVDWQDEPLVTPSDLKSISMGLMANDRVELLED